MPVLSSINGTTEAYDKIQAPAPSARTDSEFSSLLFSQLPRQDLRSTNGTIHSSNRSEDFASRVPLAYGEVHMDPRRTAVLYAHDVMTKHPHCVFESVTLNDARQLMNTFGFRHVPVLTKDRRLCGMLSDRDVLRAGPSKMAEAVAKNMTVRALTATPDTPIQEIAKAMLDNGVHAIPIINTEHRIVGILTTTDILRAIVRHAPIDLWT